MGFPGTIAVKIFRGCQRMAEVPNAVEILPKISTAWGGCTSVTDDRQTSDRQTDRQTGKRQTDGRQHIANVLTFSKNNKKTFLIKLHIENAVLSMTSMLYQAVWEFYANDWYRLLDGCLSSDSDHQVLYCICLHYRVDQKSEPHLSLLSWY